MRLQQSETQLHKAVAKYLDITLSNKHAFWTTIPAGGGGKIRGAHLKDMGYKAGTPDIMVMSSMHDPIAPKIFWIELKSKTGRVSPAQLNIHAHLFKLNSHTYVCRSLEDVQHTLRIEGLDQWK